ncbi:MAG: hypothetical protein B7Z37_28740 [Verrucomicrobia bacterium 12-59-8]|nr:MAG: hypothetical protein B7Z37_28740 [Verrucomicrobia bacterium 12-59-8]
MAAYEREKAAYEKALVTAADNQKFNFKNKYTLKAWENYDRAIQMMENAPEGRKVLAHLRNDKTRVFKVVMLDDPSSQSYEGVSLTAGAQAQHINTGKKDAQGREIHVILMAKPPMVLEAATPDGKTNPDAEALENVWHELYHAAERYTPDTDKPDPLGLGTAHPKDRFLPPWAHEKRAVRFENIIRARNGGTRQKKLYGGGRRKNQKGEWEKVPPIEVFEPMPKLPPLD